MGAARIAASNRIDQSLADNASVTNWTVGDDFILAIRLDTANYVGPRDYRLRWRNVTSGGSFANLGSSGELTYNSDTVLVDKWPILIEDKLCLVTPHPTYIWVNGEEVEGDSTGSVTFLAETYSELQYGVNCTNAIVGSTYEFQLYDATQSYLVGTCLAQISIVGSSSSSKSSSSVSSSSKSSSSSSKSSSSASSSSSSRRGKTYRFRSRRRYFTFTAKA